jgi:predicted nucleotidyltransferase
LIHPKQLPFVRQLLSLPIPSGVDNIIVFGSSLGLTLHRNSDLDLYLISNHADHETVLREIYVLCKSLKCKFDLLIATTADFLEKTQLLGTVESRIARQGVCIYAKEEHFTA